MVGILDVVDLAKHQQHAPKVQTSGANSPSSNKLGLHGILENGEIQQQSPVDASPGGDGGLFTRNGMAAQHSLPNTPRSRPTNIPRSSSINQNIGNRPPFPPEPHFTIDPYKHSFVHTDSDFRGAWSYHSEDSGSRRPAKRRASSASSPGGRSPPPTATLNGQEEAGFFKRWIEIPLGLVDPNDETDHRTASPEPQDTALHAAMDGINDQHNNGPDQTGRERSVPSPRQTDDTQQTRSPGSSSARQTSAGGGWTEGWTEPLKLFGLARSRSLPHFGEGDQQDSHDTGGEGSRTPRPDSSGGPGTTGHAGNKWALLRHRLRTGSVLPPKEPVIQASKAAEIDLNDELLAGGLGVLLLRMYFDRDENDRRRVPVLLHHLKIRVSDSVHPMHGTHAVFRIECEYAGGAAKWVIYRELRDFVSLHGHYKLANSYRWADMKMPEFPRTSLPYFNLLKREGREKGSELGREQFAKMQRESLENYLIGLIKAVMFRPEANRLCRWFEISALSVALGHRGGIQGKAGLLRVVSGNSSRKATHTMIGWKKSHEPKWWIVRESYLVAVEEPGELAIFDVFLLDPDFTIERPKRYYRQGLNLLHHRDDNGLTEEDKEHHHRHKREDKSESHKHGPFLHPDDAVDNHSLESRSTISKFFSMGKRSLTISRRSRSQSDVRPSTSTANGTISEIDHAIHPKNGEASGQGATPAIVQDNDDSDSSSEDEENRPVIDPSIGTDPRKVGVTAGKKNSGDVSQHTFYIKNSQRRLKLVAKNERQMMQFIASMERMAAQSHWNGTNRFDSFAPIRLKVAAQWLVDGRDYFWNLSRALMLAKERIYIHDWWLSPELYLRRPGKEAFRLDKILKRKAEEGVKVFVILYKEVSNRTTPTDSNYAKQRLMSLHPNIMVQRSPSHFATGTFYWAHHEKLCVIDETIAFMGGVDACFGRWDTPQHTLIDDGEPHGPEGSEQIWVGKDYSNARVMDFHSLNKPEQDMYDRTKVARMPWHDIGMQIVGQPARDLCRHFVQRWNYLLRVKNHSRVMPFLLPPPDFKASELVDQGLTGTCELQICRSAGPWSLGTANRIEHSIQNAYLKAIQMSEHFVYIENQFFITSTTVNEVPVENKIGDALVNRIIQAHQDGKPWRACIVIPLLPGFTFPVDHNDASAIRLIMECQNRSICRGPNSIFARLRKEGIDPDEYITFFSLRGWGKLANDVLTTEQVYIHAKIMVVDDRLVIIGSANINERSLRGDRDSELAAVIRDTDMMDGTMAGRPFRVGRFAHTLRVRLMREHIGVDVDAMFEEDNHAPSAAPEPSEPWDPDQEQRDRADKPVTKLKQRTAADNLESNAKDAVEQATYGGGFDIANFATKVTKAVGFAPKDTGSSNELARADERKMYGADGSKQPGFASSKVPTLEEKMLSEQKPDQTEKENETPLQDQIKHGKAEGEPQQAKVTDGSGELYGAPADASTSPQTDDRPPNSRPGHEDANDEEKAAVGARSNLRKHLSAKLGTKGWTVPTPAPEINPHGFDDPLDESFFKGVWTAAAVHNTEIYRKVFHCTPDDLVTTWKQYKEFLVHQDRLSKPARDAPPPPVPVGRVPSDDAPLDTNKGPGALANATSLGDREPSNNGEGREKSPTHEDSPSSPVNGEGSRRTMEKERDGRSRRPTHGNEPFEQWERDEMEALLLQVKGHLVVFPTRFLEGEDTANNFLFNADRLLPMPIYN